ncbi:HAD family hydrolase [Catenulispora rubra]|uniref:HAD family hydrolase n=1 Tax=Catenulispora rubra TaxID=280293 RepID=UPI0018920CA8|nr:HAD hydrolase-like protein [Catenulispora rubra]
MGPLALFDLDDTLIVLAPAFRRFAQDFVRGFALPAEAEEWLVEAWDPRQKRDAFFARVRERYGLTEPVEELWRLYRSRMPQYVELRDEVRDGLVAMRRAGWRLGIVTNGGWMVGDNAHADIEGGAAAGLRTVWIGVDGEPAPRAATATVKDVVEAFPLLLTCR